MAWLSTASFNPYSLTGPHVAGGAATSRRSSGYPDWALLRKTARISAFRNATTAGCCTTEGRAVEVSFWLVDPPGISYFSVHCPGLQEDDFSGEPQVVCAEAAFVLFRVRFSFPSERRISTHHFVYTARGTAGPPSLHLLPEPPGVEAVKSHQLGLLSRVGEHYAVVFLDPIWTARGHAWQWQFDAHVFSSETQAWSKKPASSLGLSECDAALLRPSATSKQIAVGASTLGWVDMSRGITLVCNLFDECPVVKYIPFPGPRACVTPSNRLTIHSSQCLRDVACCDGLIKFVEVDFDEPDCVMKGKGWRTTTWTRNISSINWSKHTRVDVADVSVDPRYSALLPELWDDGTQELELKKLVFLLPTLSLGNDDLLYIMARVGGEHDKAWVVAVDMKSAVVEGLAPVSTGRCCPSTMFSPCAFPGYLNDMTQGLQRDEVTDDLFLIVGCDGEILGEEEIQAEHKIREVTDDLFVIVGCDGEILGEEEIQAEHKIRGGPDMDNPGVKLFKRMSASQCVLQVLLTQCWFRELDEWLNSDASTCNACCKLLRYNCPASALCFEIQVVVDYASYHGQGDAASKAVDFCLRVLDDFYKLLEESPLTDPSTTEAIKSQISVALGALDNILEFVPLTHMPRSIQEFLVDVSLEQKEQALVGLCGHCEKAGHTDDQPDEWQHGGSDSDSDSNDSLETEEEYEAHVLDWRLGLYWLCFVGCVLVAVTVRSLLGHLRYIS